MSYTLPVQDLHGTRPSHEGLGDLALNYRYQAVGNGEAGLAISPRLSLLLPTGRPRTISGRAGSECR